MSFEPPRLNKRITLSEAMGKWGWPNPPLKSNYEILLGDGCDAACLFCCAYREIGKWLPLESVKRDILREKARGTQMITFSGGEPGIYPRLAEAAAFARNSGFRLIQMVSNGLKLSDPEFAGRMAGAGLNLAKISIHGVNAATHDYLTGRKGAFEKALTAVNNLNRLGIYTSTNMALTRVNYRQLPLYVKFFHEEMALSGFCFYFSFYTGRMAADQDLQVPYSEVLPYVRHTLEYMRLRRIGIDWKVLGNFLPCLMPEYANLMMDWGAASVADTKASVRKKGGSFTSMEFMEKRKIKPASCRGCVYYSACYGVDARYCERFGTAEFRPVKEKPRAFPLRPVY
ncbi:MAG TPA: hypothetical protein DCS63_00860 [Elusimicrobia bacterium]|nr:hypothetical protein [Elusimicrobiota bacterium]